MKIKDTSRIGSELDRTTGRGSGKPPSQGVIKLRQEIGGFVGENRKVARASWVMDVLSSARVKHT